MPSWTDFMVYKRLYAAIVAPPGTFPVISLGPSSGQSNPAPIQKVTLVTSTTSNPTATYVVEGSLDGITWFTIITPAAVPTVGVAKKDAVVDVNILYARVNVSALTVGNLTVDILCSGDPAT
jgi:hypothetical protein